MSNRHLPTRDSLKQKMLRMLINGIDEETKQVLPFNEWLPTVTPQFTWDWPHLLYIQEMLDKVAKRELLKLMIFCPPRHGKCCYTKTPVLTPTGWTEHGKLRVGDSVYSPSGKAVKVIGRTPNTSVSCKVTLSNGEEVICHENHEWVVYDRAYCDWKTYETKHWLKVARTGKKTKVISAGRCRYQVQNIDQLEMPDSELPLEPYFIGAWLGDGRSVRPEICGVKEDLEYIDSGFSYKTSGATVHATTGVYYNSYSWQGIVKLLRELGLYDNKHVPEAYILSSIEQRKQLIAGLIDTDGSVEPKTSRVRIVNVNKAIIDGAFEILTTLGQRPYITQQEPTMSTSGIQGKKVVYTLGFQPTMTFPTRIPRKAIKRLVTQRRIGVEKVERIEGDYVGNCIQVDSPDGLYLVGKSLIPTHNSEMTTVRFPVWWLEREPANRVIVTAYNQTLASKFSRNIRKLARQRISISSEKSGADEWETDAGGGVRAAGVGSGVTGMGGDLIIIDDPVKSRAEAKSLAYRNRCYEWYRDDLFTRRESNTPMILIQCLAGDSKVLMESGEWTEIRNVLPNSKVVSLDENNKTVISTVEAQRMSGNDTTYEVKTGNQTIRANARHPFLTKDGAWKMVKDLTVGDYVVGIKGYNPPESYPNLTDDFNFEIDSDFVWYMGFMFGDGWVTQWKRNNYDKIRGKTYVSTSWCVCAAKGIYEDLNNKVLEISKKIFGRTPILKEKEGYYRLDMNRAGRLLQELGLTGKAKTKRVPEWIYKLPVHLRREFICGIIDADGNKMKKTKNTYRLGSCNQNLVDDTRMLALTSGIRPTNSRSYAYTAQPPNSPRPVDSLHVTADFTDLHDEVENKGNWGTMKQSLTLRPQKIRSITKMQEEDVYDLQTTHGNFIAEGYVVHNTRWHEDDLAGRILATENDWTVVSLPALAEEGDVLGRAPGEALCPDRFTKEQLENIQKVMGRTFHALYQQRPVEQEGGFFKRSWLPIVPELPTGDYKYCRFWDKAGTTDGDYTVGVLIACNLDTKTYYVADVERHQMTPHYRDQMMLRVAKDDRNKHGHVMIRHEQEPGSAGIDAALQTTKMFAGFPVKALRASGSKEVRAEPFQAQCEGGNVFLVKGEWNNDYINEITSFPQGKYDDQVDGSSGAFNELSASRAFIVPSR